MADEERATATVSRLRRVYPARVEVEPDVAMESVHRVRYPHLSATLRDPLSMLFLLGACLAQLADTVTTALALSGRSFYEANGLLRSAVTQPVEIGALKLLLVLLVALLAMLRLPTRQARVALLVAFALSAIAPIHNILELLH